MSLQKKLILSFVGLIIVPLLVLGSLSFNYISNKTEKSYAESTELTLRALLISIDQVFRDMNNVTDGVIASRAIQDALSNLQSTDIDQINYLQLNEIQRNFRELLVNHPSVGYAFMYTLEQQNVHRLFSKASFTPLTYDEFLQLPVYQEVIKRDGLPIWLGPYEYPKLTSNEPVFTLIRVVKDIDTLKNKGILLVQIRTSDLEAIFRYLRYKQEHTKYMIVNRDGLILYDSNGQLANRPFGELMSNIDLTESHTVQRGTFDDVESVVSSISFGNYEQWKLVAVTPRDVISGEIQWTAFVISLLIGLSMLCACIFIVYIAKRVTRAITDSVNVMRVVELGDLDARVRVRGNDEIGLLTRGTNRLIYRVQQLIEELQEQHERKRAAEMAALQAQIKPHFLFNTLESINVLAIQNQGRKVSKMVTRLGNILRISMQQKDLITIEQELLHVQSYLDIQKFRFEELFEYELEVDPKLLQEKILKLSLQPLIENSIQHGFEGILYIGLIRIVIIDGHDVIYCRVEDNGIGMTSTQLERFSSSVSSIIDFVNTPEHGERRGIGVQNVAERIRLSFGQPYGLMICSAPDQGTVIQMTIPKHKDGGHYETKSITGR